MVGPRDSRTCAMNQRVPLLVTLGIDQCYWQLRAAKLTIRPTSGKWEIEEFAPTLVSRPPLLWYENYPRLANMIHYNARYQHRISEKSAKCHMNLILGRLVTQSSLWNRCLAFVSNLTSQLIQTQLNLVHIFSLRFIIISARCIC